MSWVWIIIILVVLYIVIKFTYDLSKDKYDLQRTTLDKKFNVVANIFNDFVYEGGANIRIIDKKCFSLYQEGAQQIIFFEYSTGTLTITWKFKFFQKEVVHKKHFYKSRNLSIFEQQEIANIMILEMNEVVKEHKRKVLEHWKGSGSI